MGQAIARYSAGRFLLGLLFWLPDCGRMAISEVWSEENSNTGHATNGHRQSAESSSSENQPLSLPGHQDIDRSQHGQYMFVGYPLHCHYQG